MPVDSKHQVINAGNGLVMGPRRPGFVDQRKQFNMDQQDNQSQVSDVSESLVNSSDLSVADSLDSQSELQKIKAEIERMQAEFNKDSIKSVQKFTKKSKKILQKEV